MWKGSAGTSSHTLRLHVLLAAQVGNLQAARSN